MEEVFKNRIKIFIAEGDTKEAIDALLETTKYNEETLLLSSRFKEMEKKYRLNLITSEEKNVERSRIENSILGILKFDTSELPKTKNTSPLQTLPKSNLAQIILALCAIISLIFTIIYSINSDSNIQSNEKEKQENNVPLSIQNNDSVVNKVTESEVQNEEILNNDSISIFNSESDRIELAVKDFLSPDYNQNNYFEKLIRNREFDLALKVLNIIKLRDSSAIISYRRKSILLMKRGSFDGVWFSFPGDLILTERKGKHGLYDKDGNELFKPQFDDIDPINFENLYITKLDKKYGIIEYSGNQLFEPQFDELYALNPNGLICTRKGDKYGILSKKGDEIYSTIFSEVELEQYNLSIIKVKKNGKYGYLNSNGQMILKTNIKYIEQVWAKTIFINIEKKWGVINLEGEYKLNIEYDELEYDNNHNIIIAKKGNEILYFTDEGKPTRNPLSK